MERISAYASVLPAQFCFPDENGKNESILSFFAFSQRITRIAENQYRGQEDDRAFRQHILAGMSLPGIFEWFGLLPVVLSQT